MTNGNPFFRSPSLEQLWPHGHASIGHLTPETIAYVCRYVTKKWTGDIDRPKEDGLSHYQRIDPETGEVWEVEPEYATMSRDPAIGVAWIKKYGNETFPSDYLMHNRRKTKPPKKYLELLKAGDPNTYEQVKAKRRQAIIDNPQERTKQRRETIAEHSKRRIEQKRKGTI